MDTTTPTHPCHIHRRMIVNDVGMIDHITSMLHYARTHTHPRRPWVLRSRSYSTGGTPAKSVWIRVLNLVVISMVSAFGGNACLAVYADL